MAAKHVKTTKKKNTFRAVLRTIGVAFRMFQVLRIVRDIQSALQNTGQGQEGEGGESLDSDAGAGTDIGCPPEWGFFDGIF